MQNKFENKFTDQLDAEHLDSEQPDVVITPEPNRKGVRPFWVFVLIILTAIIAGGGVYFWQNKLTGSIIGNLEEGITSIADKVNLLIKTKEIKILVRDKNSEAGEKTFIATSSETVDWKIYENDAYGYEIKYPEGWFMEEATALITDIRPFERKQDDYADPNRDIEIRILPTKESQASYSCLYENDGVWEGKKFCGWLGSYRSMGEILIGDIEAHFIQTVPDVNYGQTNGYNIFFMRKGEAIYEISYYSAHAQGDVVNKIISTFKFTK